MNAALVLALAATLIASVACAEWKRGLRVTFHYRLFGYGETFFYDIPKNVSAAKSVGWTQQTRANDGNMPSLTQMFCYTPNPVMCAIYDDNGYVAGTQIALSHKNFTEPALDMDAQGFTNWTAQDGETYWTLQQFFVSEDYLATDKAARFAAGNNIVQEDAIWAVGNKKKIFTIPKREEAIKNTNFTKQSCLPWMGQHYYYNMTVETQCRADTLMPWAPLYDDGVLVAMSFNAHGKIAKPNGGVRDWFERPPVIAVKLIVPRGPDCLYDIADNPGVVSVHHYFVDQPRLILCL